MNRAEFTNLILKINSDTFCNEHLFSEGSWLFDEASDPTITGSYIDFRRAISKSTEVNEADIKLVGSAKFGISMNPSKLMKAFDDNSDLDVIVVSSLIFRELWDSFLKADYSGQRWIKKDHGKNVFRRFLYVDKRIGFQTTYLRSISTKLGSIKKNVTTMTGISRDLKYRVYENWEAATAYHIHGIEELKKSLKNA